MNLFYFNEFEKKTVDMNFYRFQIENNKMLSTISDQVFLKASLNFQFYSQLKWLKSFLVLLRNIRWCLTWQHQSPLVGGRVCRTDNLLTLAARRTDACTTTSIHSAQLSLLLTSEMNLNNLVSNICSLNCRSNQTLLNRGLQRKFNPIKF